MVTRPLPSSTGRVAALVAALALALASAACTEPAPIEGAACNVDHRCPGGFGCTGGACRKLIGGRVLPCVDDSGCPIGRCLLTANFCVQCLEDADCAPAVCLPGRYLCGKVCDSHDDCATNLCNLDEGECIACKDREQCDSGQCDDGVCEKPDDGPVGDEEDSGRTPR